MEGGRLSQERFRETGKGSFFGEVVYERVVPQDHFFRRLNELISWPEFTAKLVRYYPGGAEYGSPPYDPGVLLKMLPLSYLYHLSS